MDSKDLKNNRINRKKNDFKTLNDYIKIVQKNIWYLIPICLLVLGVGMYKSITSDPIYESEAQVVIETDGGMNDVFNFSGGMIQDQVITNEIEVLNSRELKGRLIISLWDSPLRSELNILGKNIRDDSQNIIVKIKSTVKRWLKNIFGKEYVKEIKEKSENRYLKQNAWLYNRIKQLPSGLTLYKLDTLVSRIDKNNVIEISHKTGSTIITIKFRSNNKDETQLVLENFINIYQKLDKERSAKEVIGLNRFLDRRIRRSKRQLEEARKKMEQFQEIALVFGVSEENQSFLEQVNKVESEYYNTQAEKEIQQRRLHILKSMLSEKQAEMADKVGNVVSTELRSLRGQLVQLQSKLVKTINQYNIDHPEVENIRREIALIKKDMNKKTQQLLKNGISVSNPISFSQELAGKILQTKIELESLKSKEEQYKKIVDRYRERMENLPRKQLQYAKLKRELEVLGQNYIFLREKQEQTTIKRELESGRIKIVDHASIAQQISPNLVKDSFVYLLMGLVVGAIFVVTKDMVNTNVTSLEELENVNIPIFANIPEINKKVKSNGKSDDKIHYNVVTHYQPLHPASESFRNIRTNISLSKADDPVKKILVSSAGPEEGKTMIASNLSTIFARTNKKTLLIDCDLRKSKIHKQFGLERNFGLVDYLTKNISVDKVIKYTGVENLFVITAGGHPPNPSELLISKKMDDLVHELEQNWDYIIFDAPPILPVTDAMILANKVDFILMTVMMDKTNKNAFYNALENLEKVQGHVGGLIANKVNRKHSKQSKYDYGYDKYYKYYQKN